MTLKQIREDLREIRYYYSRKETFEKAFSIIGKTDIEEKIDKYNKVICKATPKMYDLYASLYIENNTQESLSAELGYTSVHLSRLHCGLVKFFYEAFNKKEVN